LYHYYVFVVVFVVVVVVIIVVIIVVSVVNFCACCIYFEMKKFGEIEAKYLKDWLEGGWICWSSSLWLSTFIFGAKSRERTRQAKDQEREEMSI
jgi:hypothetical protein